MHLRGGIFSQGIERKPFKSPFALANSDLYELRAKAGMVAENHNRYQRRSRWEAISFVAKERSEFSK